MGGKYVILVVLISIIVCLSGCVSLTYNPSNQNERVKMTLKR